jgi:RNA polymerase sigma factor (sigma-70 family)
MLHTDVLSARHGDPAAFARLATAHLGAVHAITSSILGSTSAGEEVTQEVLIAAWRQLDELRDPSAFGNWLRGIARRRAQDALRRQLRRREAGEVPEPLPDPAADPGEHLDDARSEAALWAALDELDAPDRDVLVQFYREGRSVRQLADQLGLAEAAVRKRLSRARSRLRAGVEDRLDRPPQWRATAIPAAVMVALTPRAARAATLPRLLAGMAATAGLLMLLVSSETAPAPTRHAPLPAETYATLPPAPRVEAPAAPQAQLPPHVVHALLAAEDARFYEHGAVDLRAIGRAMWHNSVEGRAVMGGSTLTQQLAKHLLPSQERSVGRKLKELWLAYQLERRYSKDELLALYLQQITFVPGTQGLVDGSQALFGKPPSQLTVEEAALLAGMAAGPTRYSPSHDPEAAQARQAWVLGRMAEEGW